MNYNSPVMSVWDTYPSNYRQNEIQRMLTAIRAGESVSLLGLSGAGKSNLLGFLANRVSWEGRFVLVDGNRLAEPTPPALYQLIHRALTNNPPNGDIYPALARVVDHTLAESPSGVCLLLDRFDALEGDHARTASSNLRALRDAHKYSLTFVFATRRPLDPLTELAELVFANTLWLGPLSDEDIGWNVERYAVRKNLTWDAQATMAIRNYSGGYPSFLRAVCEAHAMGCPLEQDALREHPAVVRRTTEFWADEPTPEMIALSGLRNHPLLGSGPAPVRERVTWEFDPLQFSAKEQLLLEYLRANPNQVCEKDEIIHAVWPEDKIYTEGVRDDSLAQLVRRVRLKIEPDPSNPRHLYTVPGRGYLFKL
ncbi:MAG TPA: winged helix-turn-helix domain-containing protein [Anaerolineales bacterium]|nr:winged helix-turn-helix domain-containing protein [Anaerolineales bacterium]